MYRFTFDVKLNPRICQKSDGGCDGFGYQQHADAGWHPCALCLGSGSSMVKGKQNPRHCVYRGVGIPQNGSYGVTHGQREARLAGAQKAMEAGEDPEKVAAQFGYSNPKSMKAQLSKQRRIQRGLKR